jgi:hypothetical protein
MSVRGLTGSADLIKSPRGLWLYSSFSMPRYLSVNAFECLDPEAERLKNLGVCASRASVTAALAELGFELERLNSLSRRPGLQSVALQTVYDLAAKTKFSLRFNFLQAESFLYAILRRLNTGTLAKSKMTAKTAAATSVPPTTNIGRGAMAIPQVASVEAISRSTTDDPMSHKLGRADPMRWRSRFG